MDTGKRIEIGLAVVIFIAGLILGGIALNKMPTNSVRIFDADQEKITWKDEVIAKGLDIPWDIAQEPSGRLLVTERTGKLKAISEDGAVKVVGEIPVAIVSESGLTGIALHPKYEENHFLYMYYTYRESGELLNKVVRYTFEDDQLKEDRVLVDKLAGGQIHNGGRLRFGPDGKLYILTGDGSRPGLAQDMSSLAGKVLRVNDDGSIPADNPFPNSPIYSVGHRNPQGLAWHTLSEQLFVNEHGETAHDELNLIVPGHNYGWGAEGVTRSGTQSTGNFDNPIFESGNETWAPSGLAFYGSSIWGLRNTAFMAGLRSQKLQRLDIVDGEVVRHEDLLKGKYGRLRAVYMAKDGSILVSTSNRDGRNTPVVDDDRIIKLTPVREQQKIRIKNSK